MKRVTVVDCGMGNIRSVRNAFKFLGADAAAASDPKKISAAERLILPGVGNFGDCSKNLSKTGIAGAVKDFINSGRPYLGICLGLQMLFEHSDESPNEPGLGIFAGSVLRFAPSPGIKIPHMGWNSVAPKTGSVLFSGTGGGRFYFVHSFFVRPRDPSIVSARCEHGVKFTAAIEKDNVLACQFHPEKSAGAGLKILRNFLAL